LFAQHSISTVGI